MAKKKKRKKKKSTQEELDFIRGRSDKLSLEKKLPRLGFSPVEKTASGAGSHGGGKKEKSKAERRSAKKMIRDIDL